MLRALTAAAKDHPRATRLLMLDRDTRMRADCVTIYKGFDMAASEIIFIVDESPEGGYEARALGQSIYTQADTFEALKDMVRDAVRCHFEDGAGPQIIRLN